MCYGCLYDFARDKQGRAYGGQVRAGRMRAAPSLPGAGSTGGMSRSDPLEGIELDEIDDDLDFLVDAGATQKGQPVVPRHSKERAHAADSTLDLSTLNAASVEVETKGAFQIIARSSEMQVRIPLPEGGLTIGRGEGNDVILSSRSVSRQHLRMMPLVDTVLVEDCGATNPAIIGEQELEGTAQLSSGEMVVVCGMEFEVAGG